MAHMTRAFLLCLRKSCELARDNVPLTLLIHIVHIAYKGNDHGCPSARAADLNLANRDQD